jgi:hypothetical protein
MAGQYDPQGHYDVINPDGNHKLGELRAGSYFESTDEVPVGYVEGLDFFYTMQNAEGRGRIEGLTLLRTEPEGVRETRLTLVRKAGQ